MATPNNNPVNTKLSKEIADDVAHIQDSLSQSIDSYKQINDQLGFQSKEISNIASLSTKVNNLLVETSELSGKIGTKFITIDNVLNRIKDTEIKQNDLAQKKLLNETRVSTLQKAEFDNLKTILSALNDEKNELEKIAKLGLDNASVAAQYSTQLQVINAIENDIADIIQRNSDETFNNLALFAEMERVLAKNMEHLKVMAKDVPVIKIEFDKILKSLKTNLLTILPINLTLKSILGFISDIDTRVTSFGNNLNISKDSARVLDSAFADMITHTESSAKNLDSSLRSTTNMVDASNTLNESYGTSVFFTKQMMENQIMLTKQLKLSNEEAQGIQNFALKYKDTGENIIKTILKQNKGLFDGKSIIKDVAKIGSQLVAQYGSNVEALTQAVVIAKKYALTMEDTRRISESMLDFESSISNELEAELLLGKGLNLEKARALALDGKSAEATQEMLEQLGSFEEYSNKNVIVQKAMAKAVGMTTDELSKSLRQQEILGQLGYENQEGLEKAYKTILLTNDQEKIANFERDIRNKQDGENLLQNLQSLSAQEKFEASMQTVKDLLFKSLPFITSMVDGFANLANNLTLIKGILVISAGYMAVMKTLAIATAIAQAAGAASISFGASILVGAAGAAAMAATLYAVNSSGEKSSEVHTKDGVINPKGQLTISTPEGGLIIPDKKDSLIATTNPEGLLKQNSSSTNVYANNNSSMTGMENKLSEIANLLRRGGSVHLDSVKVGTTQALAYSGFS